MERRKEANVIDEIEQSIAQTNNKHAIRGKRFMLRPVYVYLRICVSVFVREAWRACKCESFCMCTCICISVGIRGFFVFICAQCVSACTRSPCPKVKEECASFRGPPSPCPLFYFIIIFFKRCIW